MRKRIKQFIFLMMFASVVNAETQWQQIAPGLTYSSVDFDQGARSGKIHAFKIDLHRYKLQLSFAKDMQQTFANVFTLTTNKNAVLGINGGFFTPQMQPLGLRITEGKLRSRLKQTSWWGVFEIHNNYPKISALNQFQYNSDIDFAIQSGPRLLVRGEIPPLKESYDNRSALGITTKKELVIVATQNVPVTTVELARIMQATTEENGLDCTDAINLDGGSSTQLFASINNFYLSVPSFAPVTDAVVVIPRS